MKRTIVLLIGLVAVVAAATVGWVVGSTIKSPAQIEAEIEPPEPSLITVPVERMVITNDVIVRGTVRFDLPEVISYSGPLSLPGVAPVITQVPGQGEELTEGEVAYEVSGRPVFLLQGDLPLFRTLTLGAEGEDVEQLQTALARLGFDTGPIDGVYGGQTAAAVRAMYEARGYEAIGPTDEEEASIEFAEDAVSQAQEAYDAVKVQRDASLEAIARRDAAQSAATVADQVVTEAAAALAAAPPDQIADLEAKLAAAEQAAAAAAAALDAAKAEAAAAGPPQSLGRVADALSGARSNLKETKSKVGYKAPNSEFVFLSAFPVRVDSVSVERGDVAGGQVMTVTGSRLAIDSAVDVAEADAISVGSFVQIDLTRRNISVTGKVSRKADRPGTDGVDGQDVYIEVLPDEVRADLNNANVRLTIPVESTAGEVLAVPIAAVSARAGGASIVTVVDDDGTPRTVEVTLGLAAGGMVELAAIDGSLAEGDFVVVGTQAAERDA